MWVAYIIRSHGVYNLIIGLQPNKCHGRQPCCWSTCQIPERCDHINRSTPSHTSSKCHIDEIFGLAGSGCIEICKTDNFRSRQWRKFHKITNSSFSMKVCVGGWCGVNEGADGLSDWGKCDYTLSYITFQYSERLIHPVERVSPLKQICNQKRSTV